MTSIARSHFEPGGESRFLAEISREPDIVQVGMGRAQAQHDLARSIGASVVDNDDLMGELRLGEGAEDRRQHNRQPLALVISGQDDRYQRWAMRFHEAHSKGIAQNLGNAISWL